MLISEIKKSIDTYYTEIYGAIYDAAWTSYTQITPEQSLPVVAMKYVETAGYLTAWALRWTIMTARLSIIAEDQPIPYLRAFYKKANFYEQDRDLTAEELFDLFENFYVLKLPPEFPQALRFEPLRTQVHIALGGDEVVRQLVDAKAQNLLDAALFFSLTGFLALSVTTEMPDIDALTDDSLADSLADTLLGVVDGYERDSDNDDQPLPTMVRASTILSSNTSSSTTSYLQQTLLEDSHTGLSPTLFPKTVDTPSLSEEGRKLQKALFPVAPPVTAIDKTKTVTQEPSRLAI
jgi:hypothetical protein